MGHLLTLNGSFQGSAALRDGAFVPPWLSETGLRIGHSRCKGDCWPQVRHLSASKRAETSQRFLPRAFLTPCLLVSSASTAASF